MVFAEAARTPATSESAAGSANRGFADASAYGFSPEANGTDNTRALQRAVDQGGTIVVSRPGTYPIAGTVFLGSDTTLSFGNNVFLKKVAEHGAFTSVLLNKGALTKTYDRHIAVEGLQIIVNGVDVRNFLVYGLHGQLAFFYVKDLRIEHFRCLDLGKTQYAIHVCTFEDLIVNDVIIKGGKDGVHLGRGKRFTISNGIFQTGDDAVALNGHDYAVGNPELGWIEDGVVQNCHDLPYGDQHVGFFCRMTAGAWTNWRAGMEVQQSDTVASNGRLYRVQAQPDGTVYTSRTQPMHDTGAMQLDGINWGVVQNDVTYTAGVRNVMFRDIFLQSPRIAFSIHFDNGRYSRSYYPGAPVPMQTQIVLDGIRVLNDGGLDLLDVTTPVDVLTITNSSLRNNAIHFRAVGDLADYMRTNINLYGCTLNYPGKMNLLINDVPKKIVSLKTSANIEVSDEFSASVAPGAGTVSIDSDLTGLKK